MSNCSDALSGFTLPARPKLASEDGSDPERAKRDEGESKGEECYLKAVY